MATRPPGTLDCQQCGAPLRTLSPAEEQQVAAAPYNFVVYCRSCRDDIRQRLADDPNLLLDVHP